MARKASDWNLFVKKVYHDMKKKIPNVKFGDALKKASSMKKNGHMKGGAVDDMATEVTTTPSTPSTMTTTPSTVTSTGATETSSVVPTMSETVLSKSMTMAGGRRKTRRGKSRSRKSRAAKKSRRHRK